MKEKCLSKDCGIRPAATRQGPGPAAQRKNTTGMPDEVKSGMESAMGTDFSGVTVHPSSSKAPEVGALAYTQGSDIHFAPGQFRPETSAGRELLGHELAHVVQQSQGRVAPTGQVAGLPVNDDRGLEAEADALGRKAAAQAKMAETIQRAEGAGLEEDEEVPG